MSTPIDDTRGGKGIGQRIDASYGDLSAQEQRVADVILDNIDDLAVYSATELARMSGVSKATVSRLFKRLGFDGATEVRAQARALRGQGVPVGGAHLGAGFAEQVASEHRNLERLISSLSGGSLDTASRLIAEARRVLVIGYRNGYPLALHLREQLLQARDDVRVAPHPGQSMGEEISGLGARDVVVLFAFRRRPAALADVADALERRAVPVILIADPGARHLAPAAAARIECPVDSPTAFDSYAAAMSAVNILASASLARATSTGRARIADVSRLYDELGELSY